MANEPEFRETTYVKAPKNQPAGINMKDFVMTDTAAHEEKKTGVKRDLEIINEVMEQHSVMVSVMQRRLDQVKVIMNWWQKGNITSAINALSMQNDLSVAMDVLNSTFAKN